MDWGRSIVLVTFHHCFYVLSAIKSCKVFNLFLSSHHHHLRSTCACSSPRVLMLHWRIYQRIIGHSHPHGEGFSSHAATVWGGRGPGFRCLLPLPAVFLLAGDSGALCPDCTGSLRLHIHLHLPGGADHLRQTERGKIRQWQDSLLSKSCVEKYHVLMTLICSWYWSEFILKQS